ncbi:unnamed protein product [Penicillium roqueforti FM164]|uniref:Genomic scaffold, ProqFM164S02 n=1 Tax=Penicillium roqueforti (strain FM164) TaxID=1365484 RepID=W6QAQ5_PENRF|nr:unnamed protein product [Penicillium roqueforti FM164]
MSSRRFCSKHSSPAVLSSGVPRQYDGIYGVLYHVYANTSTYDHRVWKTGLPVRSAVLKPHRILTVVCFCLFAYHLL